MENDHNAVLEWFNTIRDAYGAAVVAGDVNAMGEVYAEDAVVLPATGGRFVGRDAIRASYQSIFETGALTFSAEPKSFDLSGDFAIEDGTAAFHITPANGEEQEFEVEYVAVIKKTDDGWKISRLISKPILPAE